MAVMPWNLPAGPYEEKVIPIPVFDPGKTATLWMVTAFSAAAFRGLIFVRSGQSPEPGGVAAFELPPDDRVSWPLPPGCTSIGAAYSSEHDIAVMVVYPAI